MLGPIGGVSCSNSHLYFQQRSSPAEPWSSSHKDFDSGRALRHRGHLARSISELAWSARSSAGDSRNLWVQERLALKWCLPLCAAGALLTWLVSSNWETLIPYSGFVLDGFLLPQIIFNVAQRSKGRVLTPFFYIGIMAVRALPHFYDIYRARNYTAIDSTDIYGSGKWDFYSTAWDAIIPCQGLLLAALIYLQQRFGSECLVPKRLRMYIYRYEEVPGVDI